MDHQPWCGSRAAAPPSRLSGSDGFGLLDLIVGMTVGAVMIFAISGSLTGAVGATRTTRTSVQASLIAAERIEEMRGLGWGDGLAHLAGTLVGEPAVIGGRFDPDGPGALASEPVVESATAAVVSPTQTATYQGVTFVTKTFITSASTARRVTIVVSWTEGRRSHTTRSSTLITPLSSSLVGGTPGSGPVSAAAYALSGTLPGIGTVVTVAAVSAPPDHTDDVASFTPAPAVNGAGAHTEARASAGVHRARAEISSLDVALPGLTIVGSGILADITWSAPGAAPTMTCSASVTINGTTYVNPSPDTVVEVGLWRITLNTQRIEVDGSRTIIAMRITGLDTELSVGYAWARPS